MAGKKLTREEFVEGILKPGSPHPYRKIWLEVSRDTMVELAAMIGEAVHAVSPLTRVGLMEFFHQLFIVRKEEIERNLGRAFFRNNSNGKQTSFTGIL